MVKLKHVISISIFLGIIFNGILISNPIQARVSTNNERNESEFIGNYQITLFIQGYKFTGKTSLSKSTLKQNVTTKYGEFSNCTKITYSDFSISAIIDGRKVTMYIQNQYFLKDNITGNTVYSRASMEIQKEKSTIQSEYGKYVKEISQTKEEITEFYELRERVGNSNWEYSQIKEVTTIQQKFKLMSFKAGVFNTTQLKTITWINGEYNGYSDSYFDENGRLLKTKSFDKNNNFSSIFEVTSFLPPTTRFFSTEILVFALLPIGFLKILKRR